MTECVEKYVGQMTINLGKAIASSPYWIFIAKKASWYRIIDLSHAILDDFPQMMYFP